MEKIKQGKLTNRGRPRSWYTTLGWKFPIKYRVSHVKLSKKTGGYQQLRDMARWALPRMCQMRNTSLNLAPDIDKSWCDPSSRKRTFDQHRRSVNSLEKVLQKLPPPYRENKPERSSRKQCQQIILSIPLDSSFSVFPFPDRRTFLAQPRKLLRIRNTRHSLHEEQVSCHSELEQIECKIAGAK